MRVYDAFSLTPENVRFFQENFRGMKSTIIDNFLTEFKRQFENGETKILIEFEIPKRPIMLPKIET